MTRRVGFALSMVASCVLLLGVAMQAQSHVRIVRLSYIDGQVSVDRASGQGLERAMLNSPITEGTRLVTGSSGLAEVEFEDQSSLRIADNSEVKFRQLMLNSSGAKVNEIDVVRGLVYLDSRGKSDVYRLYVDGQQFETQRETELRLRAASDRLQLSVFKGEVEMPGQAQATVVKKKETLSVDPANPAEATIAKNIEDDPFDAWNKERGAYQSAYAGSNYGVGSNAYGVQDLNYYGNYFFAPGYGYAWQPYGISSMAGWNPYMSGSWMYMAGMGYSWASPYPWGWLPYHYGSWAFIQGAGWAWLPGSSGSYKGTGTATNFTPVAAVKKGPSGFVMPTAPTNLTNSALGNPTVHIGRIGNTTLPAYIPGGRVPPNFASVVNHAGFSAVNASSENAAHGNVHAGTTFAANTAHVNAGGHVFAMPTTTAASGVPLASQTAAWGNFGARSSAATASGTTSHAGGTAGTAHK